MIIAIAHLLLLIPLAVSLKVDISSHQCNLNYHSTNNILIFEYCQSSNTSASYQYPTWEDCCHYCCGLPTEEFPIFDLQALQKCASTAPANNQTPPLVYAMVVIISLVGLMVIIFIIYRAVGRVKQTRIFPNEDLEERIIKSIKWQSSGGTEFQILQTQNNLPQKQDNCAICLEERPNARLSCLHWFHFQCFLHWIRRSRDCPLCRTTDITQLTTYCSSCRSRYAIIPFGRIAAVVDALISNKFGKCDDCQRIRQAGNIQQSFQTFKKEG